MEKLTTTEMFQKKQSHGSTPDEAACFLWRKFTGNEKLAQYVLDKGIEFPEQFEIYVSEAQRRLVELTEIYPQIPERIPVWEAAIDEAKRRFNEEYVSRR